MTYSWSRGWRVPCTVTLGLWVWTCSLNEEDGVSEALSGFLCSGADVLTWPLIDVVSEGARTRSSEQGPRPGEPVGMFGSMTWPVDYLRPCIKANGVRNSFIRSGEIC